ncbi:hypothetical protein FACS1894120_3630 [Clostridia bacterium]|nr:hypothetical protein FACS1894120_3630 [Clostridia bacterium]
MKSIIMAGGEGTRLRPVTENMPKPLVPLCGRPALLYILDLLHIHGCSDVLMTLHYRGEDIERLFQSALAGFSLSEGGRTIYTPVYKGMNIRFSYENEPLGTAGCIRRAYDTPELSDFFEDDSFLIISGDALCDFNLSEAINFHSQGAAATLITKRVDDPREYGLVIADEKGHITGFTEKPSYTACNTDLANTGVYVCSRNVIDGLPAGEKYDFAKDVFPKIISDGKILLSYEEQGYWCDIGDTNSLRTCQLDIINNKVKYTKTDTIFADSEARIKSLNAKITGNIFVGDNVSLGANVTIENSIIGSGAVIKDDCVIHGAVIGGGAFVGNGTLLSDCILCEGAQTGRYAAVTESGVIGKEASVGENARVISGAKVWGGKQVPAGVTIASDLRFGRATVSEMRENGFTGETGSDITPSFVSKLGGAIAAAVIGESSPLKNSADVAVSCSETSAGLSLKLALISGITGSGAGVCDCGSVPRSMLVFAAGTAGAAVSVFVRGGERTEITILDRYGLPLTREHERKLLAGLNKGEYPHAAGGQFGTVKKIPNIETLYRSMLYSLTGWTCGYSLHPIFKNSHIEHAALSIFEKISASGEDRATGNKSKGAPPLIVEISEDGASVSFTLPKTAELSEFTVSHNQLMLMEAAYILRTGYDVALPADFPLIADDIAVAMGRRIRRFSLTSGGGADGMYADADARSLASSQLFLRDGVVLALDMLFFLSKNRIDLRSAVAEIPVYSGVRREVPVQTPPHKLIAKLFGRGAGENSRIDTFGLTGGSITGAPGGEGIIIRRGRERVMMRSARDGGSLLVYAESLRAETASELCKSVEDWAKSDGQ